MGLEIPHVFGIVITTVMCLMVAWGIGYRSASDRGQLRQDDLIKHYDDRIAKYYVPQGDAPVGYEEPWRLCIEASRFGRSVDKTIYSGKNVVNLDDSEALTVIVEAVNNYYKLKRV